MKLLKNSILLTTTLLLFTAFAAAQPPRTAAPAKPKNPLVGHWFCEDENTRVEIRENGSLTINGSEYFYKVKNSVITIVGDEGAMIIPFRLEGDTLTAEVEGRELVYTRVKPGAKTAGRGSGTGTGSGEASGGIMQDLVGKWCYISSLTGTNSRMSSRCFTLYANGTYEYYAETSSSGAIASSASQESDSGRWSATRTTMTAYSNSQGKLVFPMELRNHPKTGDPMIVLDGDAFVTAYQKRPW